MSRCKQRKEQKKHKFTHHDKSCEYCVLAIFVNQSKTAEIIMVTICICRDFFFVLVCKRIYNFVESFLIFGINFLSMSRIPKRQLEPTYHVLFETSVSSCLAHSL